MAKGERRTGERRTEGESRENPAPEPSTQRPHQRVDTLTVHHIALELIDQGDQLIRQDQNDDEITELAADIAAHGLLQPIGVAALPSGRYQLLFGARRLLAHRRLRRDTIPATLHTTDDGSIRATAARENLLRRQLTLEEEIHVVYQLHEQENRSPEQIASLLSRSRAWVLRRLAVRAMPHDLREPLLEGVLSLGHAEALALVPDEGLRAYAYNQVRAAALSVSDTKRMVEVLRESPSLAPAVAAGIEQAHSTQAPSPVYIECEACHRPRPLDALAIVRVCAGGCQEEDNAEPEHHKH